MHDPDALIVLVNQNLSKKFVYARGLLYRLPATIWPECHDRNLAVLPLLSTVNRFLPGFTSLLLAFLLTGCNALPGDSLNLTGNVLLWHSWDEADTLVLEQVLERVTEIEPGTAVIAVHVPADELLDQYILTTEQGVGPDLLLGSSEWTGQLVEAGVVRPIDFGERELVQYLPTAMATLQVRTDGQESAFFGFPLSLYPVALYRNTRMAATSPITLDEMLAHAEAGESVALVPRFQPAYWGIQAFGDGLFDTAGTFTLAQSGFTEWLTWLNDVQHEPGIILNVDETALQEMFMEQRVAYFATGPEDLRLFSEALGEDSIGVAPLPSGPVGLSGPLLPVEAVMLSTASSQVQSKIALAVARFLTNPQQSTTFMRELGRVPANRYVEVDPRVYPVLSGFAQQSRTAVALPNDLDRQAFYVLGDRAYASALSGVATPEEAVCEFGLAVVELQGYDESQADLPQDCVPTVGDER